MSARPTYLSAHHTYVLNSLPFSSWAPSCNVLLNRTLIVMATTLIAWFLSNMRPFPLLLCRINEKIRYTEADADPARTPLPPPMSAAPLHALSLKSLRVRRDAYKPDRSCIVVERRADKQASEGDEDAAEHEEVCVCVRECECECEW